MKLSTYIRTVGSAVAVVLCLALSSCGMMTEDAADCHVAVRLKYDMNMKFADAFDHEVRSVTLYAFSPDGRLAFKKTATKAEMPDGVMTLDGIEPGEYDLMVWAEGEERNADAFVFGQPAEGAEAVTGLTARINRSATRAGQGRGEVTKDLTPLYHGMVKGAKLELRSGVEPSATIDLTKNTNVVRVVLQDNSGAVDASKFRFEITDDNGYMNYDNSLLPDDSLTYRPWAAYSGSADAGIDGTDSKLTVVVAEMPTGRLVTSKRPRLTIFNDEGGKVLSIPLIDYFLLVKGNYNRAMSDQEYLDRQDEYSLTFFLNEGKWLNASVIINSWRVVLGDTDMDK